VIFHDNPGNRVDPFWLELVVPVGTDLLYTVPANASIRLQLFHLKLTTSAAVANRRPYISIWSPTGAYAWRRTFVDIPPSQNYAWSFTLGGSENPLVNRDYACTLPNLWLPAGTFIGTQIGLIDAADQIDQVILSGLIGFFMGRTIAF